MFRQLIIFITILSLHNAPLAFGDSISTACGELWKKKNDQKKCVDHVKLFEVPVTFIKTCQKYFQNIDDKWNCVKSGANESSFKICRDLHWTNENTLTCLRSSPSSATAEACRDFSPIEDTQVSCLRTGREVAQIRACTEWSMEDKDKVDCLRMDIPAEEIRICAKRTKNNIEAAKKCLLNFVANRENNFNIEMAAARKEIYAREQSEKSEKTQKNNRMPASVKSK